jgi:hypothetical protein
VAQIADAATSPAAANRIPPRRASASAAKPEKNFVISDSAKAAPAATGRERLRCSSAARSRAMPAESRCPMPALSKTGSGSAA